MAMDGADRWWTLAGPRARAGGRSVAARWWRSVVTGVTVAALLTVVNGAGAPAAEPYDPMPQKSPWGPFDEAGASNTQTAKKVLEATKLIKTGKKYSLGHEYHLGMPLFPGNSWLMELKPPTPVERHVSNIEYFQGEIGQNGTQFDALGHFGLQPEGALTPLEALYYNRFTGAELFGLTGLNRLGVENMKPFFTRGVLLDVARYVFGGLTLPPGTEITLAMVQKTLAAQEMSEADIREGDVELFRTGWEENWGKGTLVYYAGAPGIPGAVPGIGLEVAKWLASKKVACVGADNWGVGVAPNPDAPEGVPEPVHNELLVKNGIPHQESMRLSELAADAAAENLVGPGRDAYTFAYIFVPVPVRGASGSPGAPLAVK